MWPRLIDLGLSASARCRAVAAIDAEEAERRARRAISGYDYTFSIPKSASVLWAVANAGTQSLIVDAHHAADADVVAQMEREVCFVNLKCVMCAQELNQLSGSI